MPIQQTNLPLAGTYIHDYAPVEILEKHLSQERCLELIHQHLGLAPEDVIPFADNDLILNKGFVDLSPPDPDGITLALYNHDGHYSLRTYKKR